MYHVSENYNNPQLYCGSGIYTHAIVIKTDPLVLVSEWSDMRWETTLDEMELKIIGKAFPETIKKCMRRLDS